MKYEDLQGIGPGSVFDTGLPKHPYFEPEYGDIDFNVWYADNEICTLEIRFSVPASEWNEFQSQPFFRELTDQLKNYRLEIPETHTGSCAPGYKGEIPPYVENPNPPLFRKSLWERVHKWFQTRRHL